MKHKDIPQYALTLDYFRLSLLDVMSSVKDNYIFDEVKHFYQKDTRKYLYYLSSTNMISYISQNKNICWT